MNITTVIFAVALYVSIYVLIEIEWLTYDFMIMWMMCLLVSYVFTKEEKK